MLSKPKIQLKLKTQRVSSHKNPNFLKTQKGFSILKDTPPIHISKHTTKMLNPYLGHEF